MKVPSDDEQALRYLMRFLSVEGTTGREARIGSAIAGALGELGVPEEAMVFDDVHRRIPLPTESGNLIVTLPGADPELPGLLFSAHRDTVDLAAGAKPVRDGDRIVADGTTALGGDNRAGVACLVNLVAVLLKSGLPHPPLRLLFTVREESGLWGTRQLRPSRLEGFRFGCNIDGPSSSTFFIGAVGIAQWEARILGQTAHAGLHPGQGISAPMVAAAALADIAEGGWFGAIRRGDGEGKSNVGLLSGRDGGCVGGASNVIADYIRVEGEARSHDEGFLKRILQAYRAAFERAAERKTNDNGEKAKLEFQTQSLCHPFRLEPHSDLLRFALERAGRVGVKPNLKVADGGLDANWLVRHGLPTITFGAGQRNIHSVREYVDIPDYLGACRLAVAFAMQ